MMNIWSMTDTGLVRRENQDAYAVKTVFGHTICVVCDGMGGAAGGQMASRIAVDTFSSEMEKRLSPEAKPDRLREVSVVAVALANRAVREAARLTGGKAELAEEEKAALDARLRKLRPGSSAAFTVFRPDERKEGGAYVTAEGVVRRIDGCAREIVLADGRRLGIEDILEVRLLAPEGET